jgi:hypothetical protein
MIRLKPEDAKALATALTGLAATVTELHEIPSTPFQINTSSFRIELKVIQSAQLVYTCGNCRGYRRGQGSVSYCDDPRSLRTGTVVLPGAKPCQCYERVHNGE